MKISEDDAAAIRGLTDGHLEAILAHDPDAFISSCTEDIQFFPPDAPTLSGKAACRNYLENFPTPKTFTADIQNLEGDGDLAYWQGQVYATFDDSEDSTLTFLAIARRQSDGSWKLARDMYVAP